MTATPIRRQYLRIKRQHPDALVFFRLGDFYETFDDDARVVAQELEIVLTSRPMGGSERVPLAGVPYHSLETHLARLVSRGYKVAICEQVGDPTGRGPMEREVVRVVTPGTVLEPTMLEGKANNYLAALAPDGDRAGLARIDISTSDFATTQLSLQDALMELERLRPAEVLVAAAGTNEALPLQRLGATITPVSPDWCDPEAAHRALLEHFGVATLEGYGCEHLPLATAAAGAVLRYLQETQKGALRSVVGLATYSCADYMALDAPTRRNLELFQAGRAGTAQGSLLSVLDQTRTPMGGRLLRGWVSQPLVQLAPLEARLDGVEALVRATVARRQVAALLGRVGDLERLVNRVRANLAGPRELLALRRSLEVVPELQAEVAALSTTEGPHPPVDLPAGAVAVCRELAALVERAIEDDPPASLSDGGVIRPGFATELDAVRRAAQDARDYLAGLERGERERTGIKSLKVGYNRVFGYYIEVSNAYRRQVPADYQRKQTLVDAERYFTPELKEYETVILNAQERGGEMEGLIYRQVCGQIAEAAEAVMAVAAALAQIDVLAALAEVAVRNGYVRPALNEGDALRIVGGRHPVVELALEPGAFVPNDVSLSGGEEQILVLTGPNMSGKSTYLRQVALIVLMAQIGSFVPADHATIGLVDRIFTRVGAQDDLATGQSTFMVEMVETANILHHATPRSLIILDEIGRGTSTYDGMAIARAVVEYLHNHPRLGAKTLFATHYHELTELAQLLPRVKNYHFAVAEEEGRAIFLRRLVPGGADKSYGIHVAQLAGLPRPVIGRAQEILAQLGTLAPATGHTRLVRRRSSQAEALRQALRVRSPH
ncbi:MAG: DNA mismatch repair protein MutS, partial [Chloroflexi bacterium]|nr:DNA mismatch repair protein MutS [Chloroflexota bacterium]